MSFKRNQGVTGNDPAAYSPTEIDVTLDITVGAVECPNCLIADVTVTPADKRQRYVEAQFGGRWIRAENYVDDGYPFVPDVDVAIFDDGVFRATEDQEVALPAMRVFARDGYRGGMVEKSVPSDQTNGWYKREVEAIYGVGLEATATKVTIRMVPGGERLTPKHLINGGMAYDLFTASCYAHIWRTAPTWALTGDQASIVEPADVTLATAAMTLVGGAQPYFEVEFDVSSVTPALAGTIYIQPWFSMQYANPRCEALLGPLNFGPTAWDVEVDGKTYPYVGKAVIT